MNQFKFEDNFFTKVENVLQENDFAKNNQGESLEDKTEDEKELIIDIMDFKKIFSK